LEEGGDNRGARWAVSLAFSPISANLPRFDLESAPNLRDLTRIVLIPTHPASMRFQLIDAVLERTSDRIVAVKQVTAAEEYLGDHFPGFPVLPGVLMIEAMVQSARQLLAEDGLPRHVLGQVRAVRYGRFVRPGESLRIEVQRDTVGSGKPGEDGSIQFRGTAVLVDAAGSTGDTAVSGRFTMRAMRTA